MRDRAAFVWAVRTGRGLAGRAGRVTSARARQRSGESRGRGGAHRVEVAGQPAAGEHARGGEGRTAVGVAVADVDDLARRELLTLAALATDRTDLALDLDSPARSVIGEELVCDQVGLDSVGGEHRLDQLAQVRGEEQRPLAFDKLDKAGELDLVQEASPTTSSMGAVIVASSLSITCWS